MALYQGQKLIRVNKEVSNRQNLYSITNLSALEKALLELDGNTFKLWSYINKNQNGFVFGLSPKDVCGKLGISKPTYLSAVRNLIDCGYLIEDIDGSWKFYEKPKEIDKEIILQVVKEEPDFERDVWGQR